jgi:carboxylesterase
MPESHRTPDPGAPPSCLFLHGLGGNRFELAPLIDSLQRAGCALRAPVLPGHAVTGPTMPASTWPEWIETAEASFDELAALGRPVVVVGFSTGGTLALLLATRRSISRLVLLAPFLAIRFGGLIPFHPSIVIRPIARFLPDLPRRPAPLRDSEARRRLDSVERFQTFSLRATLSALELIERVKPLVPTIQMPTLILQGKLDTVVEPLGAAWLARHLGSPVKQLLYFSRSDHLLALDIERDRVIAASTSFALAGDDGEEFDP